MFYLTLFQAEPAHWRSWWGWWTQEAQTGGSQPSLRDCCGCASTQRCQTSSQAPTASPWSGEGGGRGGEWVLAGSQCGFIPGSRCTKLSHNHHRFSLRRESYHTPHIALLLPHFHIFPSFVFSVFLYYRYLYIFMLVVCIAADNTTFTPGQPHEADWNKKTCLISSIASTHPF